MRVDSQPAYILHTRPYRNSSLLVEYLTPDYGRVSGVVKGVRSSGKAAKQRRSLVQPFVPQLVCWRGRGDLKTVTQFESQQAPLSLQGVSLFSALYVNELLSRLLPHYDESHEAYSLYHWVMTGLEKGGEIDIVLRHFELQLLDYLGYGLDFASAEAAGEALQPNLNYHFEPGRGFSALVSVFQTVDDKAIFSGLDLINIATRQFDLSARRAAKRLCRLALSAQLGAKPLKSRELFS